MTPQTTQAGATTTVVTSPSTAGIDFFNPSQFDTMQRACTMFSASELVPDCYRAEGKGNTPQKAVANCMIALDVASRIGASPLMVMQNLYIVYGRPSWSAKFLIATVNTCGRFEPLKFRFTNLGKVGKIGNLDYSSVDNIECVAYTKAKGSDELLESSPISISLAIKEGWYTKNGSKWQTMPKQMLMYRAASWWTSVYAPELSMGMRTVEENEDIQDVEYEDVTHKLEREVEAETASVTLGFVDEETGEIKQPEQSKEGYTAPSATPTQPQREEQEQPVKSPF